MKYDLPEPVLDEMIEQISDFVYYFYHIEMTEKHKTKLKDEWVKTTLRGE